MHATIASDTTKRMPRKPRKAAMTPAAFRKLLKKAALTTRAAAELLGVGNGTISQWRTGNTPIGKSAAKLIRLLIGPNAEPESKK